METSMAECWMHLERLLTAVRPYLRYFLVPVGVYLTGKLLLFGVVPAPGSGSSGGTTRLVIRNRTVLISGASSGLGRALAFELYKRGARLILTARSIDRLRKLCEELCAQADVDNPNEPIYHYLDVCDPNGLDKLVALAPNHTIDVLINNAGISMRGSCRDTSIAVHRQVMEVNYFGHVIVTQALLNHIADDGAIVYISSMQGRIAVPYRCAYSASKHAAQAFFDSLRCEEFTGRQVLVVSAAYLNTGFGRRALDTDGRPMATDDLNQAKGLRADVAAERVVNALIDRKTELILAPLSYRLAIFLRWLCPNIFFYIMYRRGQKDGATKDQ